MRRPILALSAALVALATATAAIAETTNLPSAVMVEWTFANCPPDGIPAALVAFSGGVIEAAPADEVETIRARMRDGVATHYPDKAAACADMLGRIKSANP